MLKNEHSVTSRRDNDGLHKRRGIWYYCLVVNGERRFFSTKTRNYQDARRKRADAIKAQQENRLPTDYAKLPFEKLVALVLEDRKLHLAETPSVLRRSAPVRSCAISPAGECASSTMTLSRPTRLIERQPRSGASARRGLKNCGCSKPPGRSQAGMLRFMPHWWPATRRCGAANSKVGGSKTST